MAETALERPAPPLKSPVLTCIVAWLIPGAGHLLLGRRVRGLLLFVSALLPFAIGLAMHGPLFEWSVPNADVLSKLINIGGVIANVAAGGLYFAAVGLGYAAPDVAGHNADYGSKLLVCAGLLNILAIVDAYEIATRQKD